MMPLRRHSILLSTEIDNLLFDSELENICNVQHFCSKSEFENQVLSGLPDNFQCERIRKYYICDTVSKKTHFQV